MSVFGAMIQSMHPWHLIRGFEVGEECQINCGGKESVMWEKGTWSLEHAFVMQYSCLLVDDLPRQGMSTGLRQQDKKAAEGIILKRRKRKKRTRGSSDYGFSKNQ